MKYLLILFVSTLIAQEPYPVGPDQNVFLLSYPASGSRWFMHCTQFLNREVWHGPKFDGIFFDDVIDTNRLYRGHQYNDHYIYYLDFPRLLPYDAAKDHLILLLRDYHQQIYRRDNSEILDDYMHLLQLYDSWPAERKTLLYYEDLLKSPETEFKSLCTLLNYTESQVDQMLESPFFEVIAPTDYCEEVPTHVLQQIDEYLENYYPNLFHTYLHPYAIETP